MPWRQTSMRYLIVILLLAVYSFSQAPPIEPGVSQELAKWRAARYSDVRYKLDLTLEKMSPVLKGTIETRVVLRDAGKQREGDRAIILDWRKIKGHEEKSTVSNVFVNGKQVRVTPSGVKQSKDITPEDVTHTFEESNEHLIFRDGVVVGENVIKLDFTSPILPSGSAITRYVDKEDRAEYIYSLFVPSDASTAFPVFDQPDLKARFTLTVIHPDGWKSVSNTIGEEFEGIRTDREEKSFGTNFGETKPISTYVFAFAAGPWQQVSESVATATGSDSGSYSSTSIYVRKSQATKFKPHAVEVFRLNREGVKFLEEYFSYKFPFPKYDLVLIPEFPFGGMEHAGATFLRESSIIFPSEPTANDHISRANLIFHEAAHQWFGDTVTMKWFDDLWLKEGFAEFMAYKTLERVMPQYNAWKAFYERNKQAAYLTDSTKGTTPIYQEIKNLSAAKSAYGNIVYRKAPSFLKQAEFYIGAGKFQTAVRAFLKKHEFGNAGWENLVREFEEASGNDLEGWAEKWVTERGLPVVRGFVSAVEKGCFVLEFRESLDGKDLVDGWRMGVKSLMRFAKASRTTDHVLWGISGFAGCDGAVPQLLFPNYQDYGYGIFLLDPKSRDYVLKNIQNETDPFLRSMMWGALWDSVRESELDPKEYVELVLRVLNPGSVRSPALRRPGVAGRSRGVTGPPQGGTPNAPEDETTVATLLNRVSTAMTYYLSEKQRDAIAPRLENLLIEKMRTAPTLGQRLTFYRAFLNLASTENARGVLKRLLHESVPSASAGGSTATEKNPSAHADGTDKRVADKGRNPSGSKGARNVEGRTRNAELKNTLPTDRVSAPRIDLPLKTKDRFDIVTKLASLNDPDAGNLLKELERTETSDDAKRYAYAARAAFPTKETKEKYWNDFVDNKEISESWIEAAFGPFNSVRQADLTLPYLERSLKELPNHKRNRKIFFVNGWLAAVIGGQKSEEALAIVNKFLADNPNLDRDLRLKILENVDVIERAVKIRSKYAK